MKGSGANHYPRAPALEKDISYATITIQTSGVHTISVTDRDRTMRRSRHASFRHRDLMTEADNVTEQRDTYSLI